MRWTRRDVIALLLTGLLVFGVILNPWLTTTAQQWQVIHLAESLGLVGVLFIQIYRTPLPHAVAPIPAPMQPGSGALACLLNFWIIGLWLLLFKHRWLHPEIWHDDLFYLQVARENPLPWRGLFQPFNEHLVVPTRLLTWLLVNVVDTAWLPWACAGSAGLLFLASLALFHRLGRRLWIGDGVTLFCLAVFALTYSYREIIEWYSATQWLFPLLVLLAALFWVAEPAPRRIVGAALLSCCGVFCYSIGVVIGPLVSIFLMTQPAPMPIGRWRWNGFLNLLPVLGMVLGWEIARRILVPWMASVDYRQSGGRGMWETFDLVGGIEYSSRLIVDRLVLANLGIGLRNWDRWQYVLVQGALGGVLILLLRRLPRPRRLVFPLALILLPYLATMPFRTWVSYPNLYDWSRYQLFPQLGLAWLLGEMLFQLQPGRWHRLTVRQFGMLLALGAALFFVQRNLPGQPDKRDVNPPEAESNPAAVTGTPSSGGG